MFRLVSALLLLWILVGCTNEPTIYPLSKIENLAQAFEHLDKSVSKDEAMRLSQDLHHRVALLQQRFKMTSPPQFHNFLVNTGLREKGLCYHWSDDLFAFVKTRNYKTLAFHLAGANIAEYWSEHNALLVVPKGCVSEACMQRNGIVIDGWRHGGELYYVRMDEDTTYRWKHRPNRCESNGEVER